MNLQVAAFEKGKGNNMSVKPAMSVSRNSSGRRELYEANFRGPVERYTFKIPSAPQLITFETNGIYLQKPKQNEPPGPKGH